MIVETLFSNARTPGDFTSSPSTKCISVFSMFLQCCHRLNIAQPPSSFSSGVSSTAMTIRQCLAVSLLMILHLL